MIPESTDETHQDPGNGRVGPPGLIRNPRGRPGRQDRPIGPDRGLPEQSGGFICSQQDVQSILRRGRGQLVEKHPEPEAVAAGSHEEIEVPSSSPTYEVNVSLEVAGDLKDDTSSDEAEKKEKRDQFFKEIQTTDSESDELTTVPRDSKKITKKIKTIESDSDSY